MTTHHTLAAFAVAIVALAGAPSVFAEGTGEVDATNCMAPPAKATTAQERAAARAARKAEGTQVARAGTEGDAQPCPAGEAGKTTAQERKEAAQKRRQAAAAAVRSGEIKSGER